MILYSRWNISAHERPELRDKMLVGQTLHMLKFLLDTDPIGPGVFVTGPMESKKEQMTVATRGRTDGPTCLGSTQVESDATNDTTGMCCQVRREAKGQPHAGERQYTGEQHCGERHFREVVAGPRTKQERGVKRYWQDRSEARCRSVAAPEPIDTHQRRVGTRRLMHQP
jgi:hypothetical protein